MLTRQTKKDLNPSMYNQQNRGSELTRDTAQVCLNGHTINRRFKTWPDNNSPRCSKCGAATITQCTNCKTDIRGGYIGGPPSLGNEPPDPFCHQCGAAYPWTESRLSSAREVAREIEALSDNEKGILSRSLDDLVRETPNTPVAVFRFKQLVSKVGKPAAEALKSILVDVIVESAKRQIWP
jgi:hypothetical protein